jgi:hypothetical protein
MQPSPQPPKSLSQLAEEFKDDVKAGELQDILEALRALKRGSGWGRIELKYLNNELDNIEIGITRKPKKKTSV